MFYPFAHITDIASNPDIFLSVTFSRISLLCLLVTVPSYAGVIGKIIGVLALIVIAIGLGYVVCMRLGKADKKHSRYPDKAAQKVHYEKLQFGAVQQRKFDLFLRKFVRSLPSLLFFCIRLYVDNSRQFFKSFTRQFAAFYLVFLVVF